MLVSVCMITYGHEKFIKQAIDGVLMQEGDFDLELIISNDKSPDNTDAIVRSIIDGYNGRYTIKYFSHEKNIGMTPNTVFTFKQCKGEYIAICEGDDFWTYPFKIRDQIAELEKDEQCVLSYHNTFVVRENILTDEVGCEEPPHKLTIEGLYDGYWTITCTMLFKASALDDIDNIINDTHLEFNLLSKGGYGKYISEQWATYRAHSGGIWSGRSVLQRYKMSSLSEHAIFHAYSAKFPDRGYERWLNFNKWSTINLINFGYIRQGYQPLCEYIKYSRQFNGILHIIYMVILRIMIFYIKRIVSPKSIVNNSK